MFKRSFLTLFSLTVFSGFLFFPSGTEAQFDSARFNTNKEPLKVLTITPAGVDVRPKRQIVFNFNRPVVPVGRMERRADEIPITIEPAVQCEWRWLNTSALACQLGEKTALAPATRYTVVVRPGIRTEDGSTLKKSITHTFVTERPKIRYSSFKTWTSPGTPNIIVQFNMPVKRTSVAQHLYLDADGTRLPLDVMEDPEVRKARERGEGIKEKVERYAGMVVEGMRALLFSGRGRTDKERLDYVNRSWMIIPKKELPLNATIRLSVEPGIISTAGPEPGVEDRVVVAFDTFPPFRFIGVRCMNNNGVTLTITRQDKPEDNRCSPLRQVSLIFSSPVAKEPVQENLMVTPDLAGGRTDYNPWEHVNVYSRLSRPHRKGGEYTVPLPYGLKAFDTYHLSARARRVRDMFDRPLPADLNVAFATDHRLPDFDFLHPVSVLESNVDTHLPVVVTNLESIRLEYETQTVKDRRASRKKTIRVSEAEDIAYYFPLKVRDFIPGSSGAIQGRWRTKPKTSSYSWGDLPNWFFSQVTPFNAHVKLGHYNTLIWVTRFDTGRPVAGAMVQLYTEQFGAFQESPEILAHAVTDKNGTAVLPGTSSLDPKLRIIGNYRRSDHHFFVRVSKGSDMALAPLVRDFQANTYGAGETYVPSYLKRRYGHIHTWGFTAQGVYKAGDTIQYKLFVRDQDNKRFVPAPRKGYTLTVIDPRGKVVHEIKDFTL